MEPTILSADDLMACGGLRQFACDLLHTWADLSGRDRLALRIAEREAA